MSGGPVGVGVIGAGKISEQYLANMTGYPDLAVRFVADLLPERARSAAERFGVPGSGTVPELLSRDDVEIVVNLTIPASHAEVASEILTAGKHVWNEKPFTTNRGSAEALLDQADRAGLLVGSAPDTFLGPGLQTVRRLIDKGDIGRPLTASVVFMTGGPHTWHPDPDFLYAAGGGPLLDMSPYYLTGLTQVFGSVARVAGVGSSAAPTRTIGHGPRAGEVIPVEVPTFVTAIYAFDGGGVAQGTFSFDSALPRAGVFEVAGTEATLAGPDPNQFSGDVRLFRSGAHAWTSIPATGPGGRGIGVVDLARAIRGHGSHRATGRLGLHVLDAMLATVESVDRGDFAAVHSRVEPAPALPEDWDPTQQTL